MRAIRKLLIANRGEIAVRIQKTAHRMGIASVAIFSDADANAPFVRSASEAVRIGPAPASDSYLSIEKIIDAAKRTGADAIHPGFGFLAENARFAQAVVDAGLIFIGPSVAAIADMGSKKEAKRLAAGAGVPVVPGASPDDQSVGSIAEAARLIGFPLLIKASAGGGGKGMRVVDTAEELESAIESAKREAHGAFSDDTLLVEKYVEQPRHVEIQILGDQHGKLVHLFERECSIQRRHQKIIEESPSPALDPELRERMGSAAVAVARAVGYHNAGTVEFILAPDKSFYFLEVNTRLQVEHPVTELVTGVHIARRNSLSVTGIDIVREQIRIAEGAPLSFSQADLVQRGHAIECRLYAEDAEHEFLPTTGTIVDYFEPAHEGVRFDSGVELGSEVGIHYDPMLAKVIAHAATREEAIGKLAGALSEMACEGLVTNREFLVRVLRHPAFLEGQTHTHFIEQHLPRETAAEPAAAREARERWAAIAATLRAREARRRSRKQLRALELGFRNNRFAPEHAEYRLADAVLRVEYAPAANRKLTIQVGAMVHMIGNVSEHGPEIAFEDETGYRRRFRVSRRGDHWFVHARSGSTTLVELPRFPEREAEHAAGACVAPMPGKIVKLGVAEGDRVTAGSVLVVLEAMKMEHSVKASESGIVSQVLVSVGEQVEADAVLVVIESPAA